MISFTKSSGGVCYWDVASNLGSISVPGKTHQWCNVQLAANYSRVQTVGASNGCECTIKINGETSELTMYCPDSSYGGSATCIPQK